MSRARLPSSKPRGPAASANLIFPIAPCPALLLFIWASHGLGAVSLLLVPIVTTVAILPPAWACVCAPLLLLLALVHQLRHGLQRQLCLHWAAEPQLALAQWPQLGRLGNVQLTWHNYNWVLLRVRLGRDFWRQLAMPSWARYLLWPGWGGYSVVLCRHSSERS
ncbi:MAG: hypothetical protein OIF35_08050, partial [Cellvibrionaceae bacterium]|nr:hypothetical protein [Cellvibrionaceae bacterium]